MKTYFAERVITGEDGFPTLILTNGENKTILDEVYLTPFRGYSFQVSATMDGEYDLGHSEVVGLGNIISPRSEKSGGVYRTSLTKTAIEKYIFELLAKEAIENAMHYLSAEISGRLFLPYDVTGQYKLFKEFIDQSHLYILQHM